MATVQEAVDTIAAAGSLQDAIAEGFDPDDIEGEGSAPFKKLLNRVLDVQDELTAAAESIQAWCDDNNIVTPDNDEGVFDDLTDEDDEAYAASLADEDDLDEDEAEDDEFESDEDLAEVEPDPEVEAPVEAEAPVVPPADTPGGVL